MAAQGRSRHGDDGVTVKTVKYPWPRQGVAAVVAAGAAVARRRAVAASVVATAVGLLPRPFVSSHSRWRRLLSFLNDG